MVGVHIVTGGRTSNIIHRACNHWGDSENICIHITDQEEMKRIDLWNHKQNMIVVVNI